MTTTVQIKATRIDILSDLEKLSHGAVVEESDNGFLVYDGKESLRRSVSPQKIVVFYARKNEEVITRYATILEGHILVQLDGKIDMIKARVDNLRKKGDGHLLSEEGYEYQLADNLLKEAGL